MIKYIVAVSSLVIVLSGCGTAQNTTPIKTQPTNSQNNQQVNQPIDQPLGNQNGVTVNKTYALDEIALHNTQSDCWLAIDGKVYNVTSFIPNHPGGDKILQGCGKDATALFNTPKHNDQARNLLPNYYIGDLAQ